MVSEHHCHLKRGWTTNNWKTHLLKPLIFWWTCVITVICVADFSLRCRFTSVSSPIRSNGDFICWFNIVEKHEWFLVVDPRHWESNTWYTDVNVTNVCQNFTLYARVDIEQHISEMSHILNTLRLWMKMWCQTYLYGCSYPIYFHAIFYLTFVISNSFTFDILWDLIIETYKCVLLSWQNICIFWHFKLMW